MELRLSDISKSFAETAVLQEINDTFSAGVYGLLGANGAGKTTLLKIITGLIKPSQGRVLYNQLDISEQAENYRAVLGFLPQDFSYYSDFTGMKFMLYIASLKGLPTKLAKKRCLELLHLVGLDAVKNKKIKKYSGEMKQRLGIAQAMINDPDILVLDEPTVGLDPKERVRFRNLISSFAKNKIVLLSTHIVSDIEYIADCILLLKNGKIEAAGTAEELVKEISNNVWEATVDESLIVNYEKNYVVTNEKHSTEGTVLRFVTKETLISNAQRVEPTLEDLYLYYFREEGRL